MHCYFISNLEIAFLLQWNVMFIGGSFALLTLLEEQIASRRCGHIPGLALLA